MTTITKRILALAIPLFVAVMMTSVAESRVPSRGEYQIKSAFDAAMAAHKVARNTEIQADRMSFQLSNRAARIRGGLNSKSVSRRQQTKATMRGYVRECYSTYQDAIVRHREAAAAFQNTINLCRRFNNTNKVSQSRSMRDWHNRQITECRRKMNQTLARWQGTDWYLPVTRRAGDIA